MGLYLQTLDDAIATVAEILELPQQRDRIIQCTIKIMLCLAPEPREFLADSQALLIEGGLEALRQKRHDLIEGLDDDAMVAVLNPEEDGLFESIGSSLDALRLSEVAYRVFPDLRRGHERWRVARALRRNETEFEELVAEGIRRRGDAEGQKKAQGSLERLIEREQPVWSSRASAIRAACRAYFEARPRISETPAEDVEVLFALFTIDDAQASEMLAALDGPEGSADELAGRSFECLTALRSLQDKAA